jgi:hypothetical protein
LSLLLPIATALAILAIYLLRPPPRPVVVPSTVLWQRLLADRSPLRERLRWLLSLLLASTIGVSLALALLDALPSSAAAGEDWLLVVDTRPTMLTRAPSGERRLDEARRRARAWIQSSGNAARFAVAAPANLPTPWLDGRQALEALDALETAWGESRLVLPPPSSRPARTVVFTDGVGAPLVPEDDVEVVSLSRPATNVGITAFDDAPSLRRAGARRAYLEVLYVGSEPAEVQLEVDDADGVRFERTIELAPSGLWSGSLDLSSFRPGPIRARVRLSGNAETDDFPFDDSAQLWLTPPSPRVAVVGVVDEPLRRALEARGGLDLSFHASADGRPADVDLEVWSREAPPLPPEQPALLLAPPSRPWLPLADGWLEIDDDVALGVSSEADFLDSLSAEELAVPRARPLGTASELGIEPLLVRGETPLLLEVRFPFRGLLWLGDPASPVLTADAAWPVLIAEAIDHLLLPPTPTDLEPGLHLLAAPLARAGEVDNALPLGERTLQRLAPGGYDGFDGASQRIVVVDVTDRDLSAVDASRLPESSQASISPGRARPGTRWLLGFALLLALFELWSYRRRLTV